MKTNEMIIKAMNTRYGVKAFDDKRRVSDEDMATILEVLRLSPSSFGLQPWKFLVVKSREVWQQLAEAAPLNSLKLVGASHLIILARMKKISQDYIDAYFELMREMRNQSREDVKMFYDMVSGKVSSLSAEAVDGWAARQVYVALGAAVTSAALLGVDTCPMEGIDPPAFDKILGLETTDYATTVGLALGYRSADDPMAKLAKVRLPQSRIIEVI